MMMLMVIACIISGSACCSGYPCFGFVATVGPTGDNLSVLLNHLRGRCLRKLPAPSLIPRDNYDELFEIAGN